MGDGVGGSRFSSWPRTIVSGSDTVVDVAVVVVAVVAVAGGGDGGGVAKRQNECAPHRTGGCGLWDAHLARFALRACVVPTSIISISSLRHKGALCFSRINLDVCVNLLVSISILLMYAVGW